MPQLKLIILTLFRLLISTYIPRQWDQIRSGCFTEKIRKEVIEIAKIASGKLVVDLGAGTRFITEGLIQKGVKVMAVGQSGSMLRIMKERIAKNSCIISHKIETN